MQPSRSDSRPPSSSTTASLPLDPGPKPPDPSTSTLGENSGTRSSTTITSEHVASSMNKPQSPGNGQAQSAAARGEDAGSHYVIRPGTLDQSMLPKRDATSGTRRWPKEVTLSQQSPEVIGNHEMLAYQERLRQEMYMKRRELAVRSPQSEDDKSTAKSPVSPVAGTPVADLPTTSTESNQTVRGGFTPGLAARTPSYPFPRMNTGSGQSSFLQRTFSPNSPNVPQTTGSRFENFVAYDRLRSDPSSPASAMTFQPSGHVPVADDFEFPTPNLYDLSLFLSSEPGLDAWWNNVIQIMTQYYKAERVTLSVPADITDIDNVPWGQKATYNSFSEDTLSMGYMGRDSASVFPGSTSDHTEAATTADGLRRVEKQSRPSLQSRHSFTAYEDNKEAENGRADVSDSQPIRRPGPMPRSMTYCLSKESGAQSSTRRNPNTPALNKQTLEQHDAAEESDSIPAWEAPLVPGRDARGRVLPVLQALDLEADPLIDHNGIKRVLERGRVIALTRNYPYLDPADPSAPTSEEPHTQAKKSTRSDAHAHFSSVLGSPDPQPSSTRGAKPPSQERVRFGSLLSAMKTPPRPPTPRFEEYEQPPPSPWSQSPAPSPAIRADPQENPFFTDAATVDEDSFNPGPSPQDYTSIQAPETIGVDNSWSVLHVPLNHVLFSAKPIQPFKLDPTGLGQKHARGERAETAESPPTIESQRKPRQPPIAILSILTPVIPYPSNLRHSLEHLAPHLATSFSLCRHYSNLEIEVAGLHRRRAPGAAFGAIGADGRPLGNPSAFSQGNYTPFGENLHLSTATSLTSPSDYSCQSRSMHGTPGGTPGYESSALGLLVDRRTSGNSPGSALGDSYFTTRPRSRGVPAESPSALSSSVGRSSRESSSAFEKRHRHSTSTRSYQEHMAIAPDNESNKDKETQGPSLKTQEDIETARTTPRPASRGPGDLKTKVDELQHSQISEEKRNRLSGVSTAGTNSHRHSLLHSYGGDFATTFQSLPPSTSLLTKATVLSPGPSRPGTAASSQPSQPPPSDRLKGLMLDSLPAQVFVALPQNGEIVWVNSRFISYRGQSVDDLIADPWASLHPEDREEYLRAWSSSIRTGDAFESTVRLRRFDGEYHYHQARAIPSRDKRGTIVQFIGSYTDIHKWHIAEMKAIRQEEIELSEAKHRLLANLIPQIIFTATEDEGVTFANEQWLSYTGQSNEGSLGLGFLDFVHPEDLAKVWILNNKPAVRATPDHASGSSSAPPELGELAKKGILKVTTDSNGRLSYTTELRLRYKTGEYRWHLIRCVGFDADESLDFGGGRSSYFGSATDINDLKLLEGKLKEAMESKSKFLSNMSHEIRTPLIGISGMVSFLQDTILNEEQRDYTNTIQTSANSLLMIINDILDLSKVDAGMMKLKHEWFHTRSLIEDVNELVSTMAISKRLELNYIVEEDVPSWVKGDKVRIRQVLLNVIGNAIKFTSVGEVFSKCRVYSHPDARHHPHEIMLQFSIIDTGRGFSKEEADMIFKPFSQIDGSSTRQHGGSGLGLVISRQLVELHGGTMTGTAEPGKGSTFTFTARFALPTTTDHPDATATPPMGPSLQPASEDKHVQAIRPFLLQKTMDIPSTVSPGSDAEVVSSGLTSSAGSDPSVRSAQTQQTARSSVSSINAGLARFSEAAKASGQDISQMTLEMPNVKRSPQMTPTPDESRFPGHRAHLRPPMYSILIICPQKHSREATTQHIEMTLPKEVPHQITAMASVSEAEKLIGGHESVYFTHVVLNLTSEHEIISVLDRVMASSGGSTSVLVLSDSVQRQAVLRLASDPEHQRLLEEKRLTFVYKPVKPSRFAVIFDPANERDLSIDLNRSSAAQMVETQKQNYLEVEKRIGNKGYKVLLVEDNPVNQKVLVRYLKKVGIDAEIAADGVECTEKVFSRPPRYYSLILCDLHMPRKDGYQACRDIRQWEDEGKHPQMPIIALSANVMSDVQEKCLAAGFNDYVTKPVDFVDLSTAMSKYF